jgi:hypothetical protein
MNKKTEEEIRAATIEEFTEKLKLGLGGCRLMYDEVGQGFVTEDVYNLINIVVEEMEGKSRV